ncbi:MAG: hypothetical protein PUB89_13820 [Oscillospiraceae bacterium]|nr:hypothetical protein [Oscillospiraceae bacterium]
MVCHVSFFRFAFAISPFHFLSAKADIFSYAVAVKGAWGFFPNKQMYFCPFAAQNTMLAIFPRTDVRFQAEQLHSAQAFAVFDSDSSPIFRRRLFAFSNKAILFFIGAVTAHSGRQFYEIHNCFFGVGVV